MINDMPTEIAQTEFGDVDITFALIAVVALCSMVALVMYKLYKYLTQEW